MRQLFSCTIRPASCCHACMSGIYPRSLYSREQRAKRTCSHVHLATAVRVKYPDACVRVFDFILFLIAIRDRNDFRCLDRCLHQFVNLLCQI